MHKTILITGASGFIGSHIVEGALALGYDVWAGVRSTSNRCFLTDARIHFVCLDLGDPSRLAEQLDGMKREIGARGWDYVVHAAGATKCLKGEDFFMTNTVGTRNLVEGLRAAGMLPTRFVFISSLSLFGAIRETPYPYSEINDEDTPCPNTAYGKSKWHAEEYLRNSGIEYVIIRPTGVYGPRERDYFIMVRSIARRIDLAVGYRPQEITFVYVLDLVQAIMKALTSEDAVGKAFIISDGCTYNSSMFSDLVKKELGLKWLFRLRVPLWFLRAVCCVNGKVCHLFNMATTLNMDKYHILAQRNWRCDIAPARRVLGYVPEWSLERGVHATVAWYKSHNWL